MKIGDMRVNRFKTPIGVDRQAPLFSFRASQEGIFSVLLYRYGEETPVQECVVGSNQSEGFRFRCPLEEAQRYQWSVSDGVQTVTSEFETGVDFHFRGITPTKPTRTAPCFYRAFYVPRELSSARLYLCVPTRHCVFLNGEPMRRMLSRVGAGYEVYDVVALLWQGSENELCVVLSDLQAPSVAAGLIMRERQSGRRITLESDESWRVYESGFVFDQQRFPTHLRLQNGDFACGVAFVKH